MGNGGVPRSTDSPISRRAGAASPVSFHAMSTSPTVCDATSRAPRTAARARRRTPRTLSAAASVTQSDPGPSLRSSITAFACCPHVWISSGFRWMSPICLRAGAAQELERLPYWTPIAPPVTDPPFAFATNQLDGPTDLEMDPSGACRRPIAPVRDQACFALAGCDLATNIRERELGNVGDVIGDLVVAWDGPEDPFAYGKVVHEQMLDGLRRWRSQEVG